MSPKQIWDEHKPELVSKSALRLITPDHKLALTNNSWASVSSCLCGPTPCETLINTTLGSFHYCKKAPKHNASQGQARAQA